MSTLSIAFKEWAAVCLALATGRQTLMLRKGGIAEENGVFRPEYDRFLLYPTYFHEQNLAKIKPEFHALAQQAELQRPAPGTLRLSHFVEIDDIDYVENLEEILQLQPSHILTQEAVTQRYHYRQPGMYVLKVKVFELPEIVTIEERAEYAGCKTWVHLEPSINIKHSRPVAGETI